MKGLWQLRWKTVAISMIYEGEKQTVLVPPNRCLCLSADKGAQCHVNRQSAPRRLRGLGGQEAPGVLHEGPYEQAHL